MSVIRELFTYIRNVSSIEVNTSQGSWIADALLSPKYAPLLSLVSIQLYSWDITHYTVRAIAHACPNLQCLATQYLSEECLLTLSEHHLPHTELCISWMPITSAEVAAQCAHALSRIQKIRSPEDLPVDPDTSEITDTDMYIHPVPHLTALRALEVVGEIDHILLPVLAQHCRSLERVILGRRSTATVEQMAELIHSSSDSLTVLELNYPSNIHGDTLITALAPYCSQLHELSISVCRHAQSAVTDTSLLALSQHCICLKSLNICTCTQVTEAAVVQLLQCCTQLQKLLIPLNCLSVDTVLGIAVSCWHCYSTAYYSVLVRTKLP